MNEKRELKIQLRDNREKRKQNKLRREELKADADRLREERKNLLEKAEKMGIVVGKKPQAA